MSRPIGRTKTRVDASKPNTANTSCQYTPIREPIPQTPSRLKDEWADDNPSAYLGVSISGFPKLFCMMGPGTGLGYGGSAMFQAEVQARYVAECVTGMLNSGDRSMEVKTAVQQEFVDRLNAEPAQMIWTHPGCEPITAMPKDGSFPCCPGG